MRSRHAFTSLVGIFLYLVPVVVVAGVTISVFFGIAFSLVHQPANAVVAHWPISGSVSAVGTARVGGKRFSDFVPLATTAKAPPPPNSVARSAMPNRPQSAPTGQASQAIAEIDPLSHPHNAQVAELVARGDVFLGVGDIASARLFYERAAEAGNARAALELGATFDPNVLAGVGLRHISGDPAKAAFWYHRAVGLGASQAQNLLKRIETK